MRPAKTPPESFLELGSITGTHGLNGTIQVYSYTRPAIGIAGYSCWWLGDDTSLHEVRVLRCWQHGKRILAQLDGINDVATAEALHGQTIRVPRDAVAVDEDEYLWQDLIGCTVADEQGELLGKVTALEDYGAQDTLIVRTLPEALQQGEWMIPFIEPVIIDVDMDRRHITVAMLPGMDACFTPRF